MEHIAAFMILIACSDDYKTCTEQPAPAVAYEAVSQCEAELSPSIRMMAPGRNMPWANGLENPIPAAVFYQDAPKIRLGGFE